MPVLVLDQSACDELLAKRRRMGGDRYDETWEGTYVMNPMASVEHQRLVMELSRILYEVVRSGGGAVLPGANVADSAEDWESNYRCPDIVVVLPGSKAIDIGPALCGGPDFLVEIRSPGDRTLEKLSFYEKLGVRELLVVDRDTKDLQLFTLTGGKLAERAKTNSTATQPLKSTLLPLSFETVHEKDGPGITVRRTDGSADRWNVCESPAR